MVFISFGVICGGLAFWLYYNPRVRQLQDGIMHKEITSGLDKMHKKHNPGKFVTSCD
jgi:hypothetical protein